VATVPQKLSPTNGPIRLAVGWCCINVHLVGSINLQICLLHRATVGLEASGERS
jgi:hypothetical protein